MSPPQPSWLWHGIGSTAADKQEKVGNTFSEGNEAKEEEKVSEKEEKEEEDKTAGIKNPRDSDVLCGRGKATLMHPGNRTYRGLVDLNKQYYATVGNAEKIKITRSIVAGIRLLRGRFLEWDAKTGTWNDIGEKKAVEKTSQALRDCLRKLRQKLVESGQIAPTFGNERIYQPKSMEGGDVPSPPPSWLRHGFGSTSTDKHLVEQ